MDKQASIINMNCSRWTSQTLHRVASRISSQAWTRAKLGTLRCIERGEEQWRTGGLLHIYLENYCSWNGNDAYSYCSPRTSNFAFDPITIWGLNSTTVEPLLPASLRDGVATYKKLAGIMYAFYVIALSGSALILLVGIAALFSKWGSFFTTAIATIAGLSAIVASTIATVLFAALDEAVNHTALGKTSASTLLSAKLSCASPGFGAFRRRRLDLLVLQHLLLQHSVTI